MRNCMLALGLAALTAFSTGAVEAASWTLDPEDSQVAFVSVKAEELGETHYFRRLSGGIDEEGQATVEIALGSVETDIEERNERMRNLFFEVAQFPRARITTEVAPDEFEDLEVGARSQTSVTFVLDLHGVSMDMEQEVFVTRIAEDRIAVETVRPVILHAADFNLSAGLEMLREVASLPSISPAVPVTVSLVFERATAAE